MARLYTLILSLLVPIALFCAIDPAEVGLFPEDLKKIYTYIENELPAQLQSGTTYFHTSFTNLACPIEYDAPTGHIFIHAGAYLADGFSKEVTKSILYNRDNPEIVARCKGPISDAYELKITRRLQGLPGIVEAKALIERKNSIDLIMKLYNARSIRAVSKTKTTRFTLSKKLKIARDLIQGLNSMHKKGFIHRDLHSGNCLIDISENGEVKAAICDFGRSKAISSCKGVFPQIVRRYRSPEGYDHRRLRPKDYKATDLYSLGCVLYKLYFEKEPPWFSYDLPCRSTSKGRLTTILQKTNGARMQLLEKRMKQQLLTRQERLEYMILRLVHPNPRWRKSALYWTQYLR